MNFKVWLEEREADRNIRVIFLRRLGFNPQASDDVSVHTMRISSYKDKIIKALQSMNLEETALGRLMSWVRSNPESTVQELLNQIRPLDINQQPGNKELPGKRAILPPGEERSMQPQQGMPGVPPIQANMQLQN